MTSMTKILSNALKSRTLVLSASRATSNSATTGPPEKTTHTGQTFEEGDYRLSRFERREKEVNPRFAINLIAEVPPIAVQGRQTFCEGGDGPLGHPRVFINLDQPGNHACGYCGLRFFQKEDHGHH